MTKLPESFFFANNSTTGVPEANLILNEIFNSPHNYLTPKVEIVGPPEAEKILSYNQKNRKLKNYHVSWLAKQMELGLWVYTGQLIGFDVDCNLINLQHTLHAIIKSGQSYPFIIQCGFSRNAIHVMDTGVARTAGDVLSMNGYPNANSMAAIIRKAIKYEGGTRSLYVGGKTQASKDSGKTGSDKNSSKDEIVANSRVLEIVKANESYWIEITKNALLFYNNYRAVSSSFYGFLYHLFTEKDADQAWEFMSKLSTGVNLRANSPIYALRQKLEKEMFAKTDHTPKEKLYWFIYCWNKFREGKNVKVINKYDPSSDFPDIK